MNPEWHVEHVTSRFGNRMRTKYRNGQRQHGGNLSRKQVFPHLLEELVDAAVYAETLDDHLSTAIIALDHALRLKNWAIVEQVKNLLTIGNLEGTEEEELEVRNAPNP